MRFQTGRMRLFVMGAVLLLLAGCGKGAASGGSTAGTSSAEASAASASAESAENAESAEKAESAESSEKSTSSASDAEQEKVTSSSAETPGAEKNAADAKAEQAEKTPAPTKTAEAKSTPAPTKAAEAKSTPRPTKTPAPAKKPSVVITPGPEKTPVPTAEAVPTEPPAIEPRNVKIIYPAGTLMIGDRGLLTAELYPPNATDTLINWTSSDPNVISLYDDGMMEAIGPGTATITAETANGMTASTVVTVDASWRQMEAGITWERDDENDIGDQWSYTFLINGAPLSNPYTISVGDTISVYAEITEADDSPDVGEASYAYTITEGDLTGGFWIELDMYVTEDTGEKAGDSAHFMVRYTFSV